MSCLPIKNRPLIVIIGPTASGKTSLSIKIAKEINAEIISADSAQIYKELPILTARVTEEEAEGIPHHLAGFLSIDNGFSVADYQKLAYEAIEDIFKRGKIPIIAGGTVLYIKAVAEAYLLPEAEADQELRASLQKRVEKDGGEDLYKELVEKDPAAAEKIHPNNTRRVIRALEVIETTGRLFSDVSKKVSPHPLGVVPYYFAIDMPRELLYGRINSRVDKMMGAGALEQVYELVCAGKKESLMKSKILGAREMISILEGMCTVGEGIELLKRNTRKYAKRQLTWLRSLKELTPVAATEDGVLEFDKILDDIKRIAGRSC